MAVSLDKLDQGLLQCLQSRNLALWIDAGVDPKLVGDAFALPWVKVWSASDINHIQAAAAESSERKLYIQDVPESQERTWNTAELIVVYDVSGPDGLYGSQLLRRLNWINRLKSFVESWPGLILVLTSRVANPTLENDIDLISALAPDSTILCQGGMLSEPLKERTDNLIAWNGSIRDFLSDADRFFSGQREGDVLDLKDANGVDVSGPDADAIADVWILLRRGHLQTPRRVTQREFEFFLSGEEESWQLLADSVAYSRGELTTLLTKDRRRKRVEPIDFSLVRLSKLDEAELGPFEQTDIVTIAAESGSGCTTLLRQIAVAMAKAGYPTLVAKPNPQTLQPDTLNHAIVTIQEAWVSARTTESKGSGRGTIPVCIVMDTDCELPTEREGLLRSLKSLNRKILVVRAVRRDRSEIESLLDTVQLRAEASEEEIVALGRHLSEFAERRGLAPLPSRDEWLAYYSSFQRSQSYQAGTELSPPLFLIGLYIFVKDRVRDERSLEQYLYRKWLEIDDPGARDLVAVLAAAGAYGLAIPYECLIRIPEYHNTLFGDLNKPSARALDVFCHWIRPSTSQSGWAVVIRHQALGLLLSRSIFPDEALAPYSVILRILKNLTNKETDKWFADNLAYRLGQRFSKYSPPFSLNLETMNQRAANAIFASFPSDVRNTSRTILHHEARYYIKVLRACLSAINRPEEVNLPQSVVVNMAKDIMQRAINVLEVALELPEQNDRRSSLLTTLSSALANLSFALIESDRSADSDAAEQYFWQSVEAADNAKNHDTGNIYAVFNFVDTIQKGLLTERLVGEDRLLELFEQSESAMLVLHQLYRGRNLEIDQQIGEDISFGRLVKNQVDIASMLSRHTSATVPEKLENSPSGLILKIRSFVGERSLQEVYADSFEAKTLRYLRAKLERGNVQSSRVLQYLYRMYLFDPIGRLDFNKRRELIRSLKRLSSEAYEPFRHDEAALCCQLGDIEYGDELFRQVRSAKGADVNAWIWTNEKVLLAVSDEGPAPKELPVIVVDAEGGWARIDGVDRVKVKIQPNQFGNLRKDSVHMACIRFRLDGLQAVKRRFALRDMKEMGIG